MAKEMMIVFVYDTIRCKKEDDDPGDAVIYFHPAWVSPTQRLSLVGQLMGIDYFLKNSLSPIKLITLQGGKFYLKRLNQYVLAIGTDRNIQDWIIERRANFLESIIKFFHCDFDTILISFNNDKNKFIEKLYQMLETYIPILQYSANLFSNMPMIKLPSTASNVFLESIQILQYFQDNNGILGGTMFYNNKVVVTQLNYELTKQLVITDPYRIKAPAERITTDFHLPIGVQLLRVYIQRKHSVEYHQQSSNNQQSASLGSTSATNHFNQYDILTRKYKKSSLPPSTIKRDTSRIFTVPEEGESEAPTIPIQSQPPPPSSKTIPKYQSSAVQPVNSMNFEKKPKYSNPLTPSVCSTPLKDVNRILHGNAVSICSATDDQEVKLKNQKENVDDIPDVVKEAVKCKRLNKLRLAVREKFEKKSKKEALNRHSFSLPDLEYPKEGKFMDPLINDSLSDSFFESPNRKQYLKKNKNHFNTITDPFYPVFRHDGYPMSHSLYNHYISSHYQDLIKEQTINLTEAVKVINKSSEVTPAQQKVDVKSETDENPSSKMSQSQSNSLDIRLNGKTRQENYRRSMSLPLKSLNAPADSDDRRKSTSECGLSFDLPQRRKLDGLQLTPLMSKLSLLATDEKTSGFCSKETTPSEFCDFSSYSKINRSRSQTSKITTGLSDCDEEDFWLNDKDSSKEGSLEKAELFICGQQSMVLMLLMEDGTASNPELIRDLWETCMNTLGRLESRLQHCLEPLPSNEHKELYSVLNIDQQWDTLHRSGLWGVTELDIVSSLHDRFTQSSNLTDIIVRTEDTVIYGNQCGRNQVFYQQALPTNNVGGLPTPADLMGIVPLKAKRKVERDHGIIIL